LEIRIKDSTEGLDLRPVSVLINSMIPHFRTFKGAFALTMTALLIGTTVSAAPTSTATFTAASTPTLRINEVLANNTRIANAGTYPDIIELFNAGTTAIDLTGKSLSDDPVLPRKFVFAAGTSIPAGGYLVVYADASTSTPGLHTGFSLDSEGDQVRLYDTTAAGGVLLDSIAFGFQAPDFSISRTGSGANIWTLTTPTPAAANASPVALGSPAALKINEWAGKITFRLDHDLIELYNTVAQPVAVAGLRLSDDPARPNRFVFPALSFIGGNGFLPLYGADFGFGLDGDIDPILLYGENNESIDQVTLASQPRDYSSGRSPDGSATISNFAVPTPGMSNLTPLPPGYTSLLNNLRITEVMYQPAAPTNAGDYEFIELQNIGTTPLDLSGVRFTNGLDYTFPPGTLLAGGAFIVVARDRTAFLSRYPSAASVLAPGAFTGALDNTGETLALTLPAPWYVHILRFRFEPNWYAGASGGGYSLVTPSPATTPAQDWKEPGTWRQSAAINGSPGAADTGVAGIASRLSNLSVRTSMAAGQTLIVGVVVSGGARNVLVRAAGPALAGFGLANPMADPRLELYNGATLTFENDNWPSTLSDMFTSVGAFAFTPGSRDAAFVQSIEGARSIQTRGTAGGVVLVEAYDTGTGNSPRLINVSARNRVGTGDDILIAGFNIAGTEPKQLLIRAVGPRLAAAPFNVPGTLNDPKLEVYNGAGAKLSENDSWNQALASTFDAVGAFQLIAGSRDAALLTTLSPGSYTVQVRGSDGGTGEALIEIYEVP
jgi:hypothetical protein